MISQNPIGRSRVRHHIIGLCRGANPPTHGRAWRNATTVLKGFCNFSGLECVLPVYLMDEPVVPFNHRTGVTSGTAVFKGKPYLDSPRPNPQNQQPHPIPNFRQTTIAESDHSASLALSPVVRIDGMILPRPRVTGRRTGRTVLPGFLSVPNGLCLP